MAKIGILGGTFDPVHLAHYRMAECAWEQCGLDRVAFMPSRIPPHKRGMQISPGEVRARMVQLALQGDSRFYFSDFELKRPEVTYTAKTLRALKERNPEDEYYFILGGDSLFYFEKWYHPREILEYATVVAVSRDGVSRREMQRRADWLMQSLGGQIQVIDMPWMDISSSMIREKIRRGEPVKKYLSKHVYEYIMEHGCYQSEKEQPVFE